MGVVKRRLDINYNLPQYTILVESLKKKFGDRLKTLGEISDVVCGPFGSSIKNSDYQENGIPLIRITNITKEGYMNYDEIIYISEELGNSLSRTQVKPRDIVISQRGTLGQCAIIDDKFKKLNISANIIAVKNIRGISPEFVRNYFLSSIGQALLGRNVSGQVQQKITTQDIADLLIPTDCNEAVLLPVVERAYKIYQQKMQQADELLYGLDCVLMEALAITMPTYENRIVCAVSLGEIQFSNMIGAEYYHPERVATINMMRNENLNIKKLDDIVSFQRDIVSSSNNEEKYLGLSGVQSHIGELSGIDEDVAGQAFRYQEEDVLYGRLRPYLNKVLLAEKSGICSTEFHVMRVKNKAKLLPAYLAAVMRSALILSQTRHMMTGNTHPRISNDDVKNLYIPVPNIEIQKEIVSAITQKRMDARKLRLEAEQEWQESKLQFDKELLGESKE